MVPDLPDGYELASSWYVNLLLIHLLHNEANAQLEVKKTVSHIYNPGGAICGFGGVNGERVDVPIGDHKLETPQVLTTGTCAHL